MNIRLGKGRATMRRQLEREWSVEREEEIQTQTSLEQRQPDQSEISSRMNANSEVKLTVPLHRSFTRLSQ